jgi:hypothetical protein
MKTLAMVFKVVNMKNAVFFYVTPCGSCKNPHFEGTYCLHYQGDKPALEILLVVNIPSQSSSVIS